MFCRSRSAENIRYLLVHGLSTLGNLVRKVQVSTLRRLKSIVRGIDLRTAHRALFAFSVAPRHWRADLVRVSNIVVYSHIVKLLYHQSKDGPCSRLFWMPPRVGRYDQNVR